jgi:hypothetical protein
MPLIRDRGHLLIKSKENTLRNSSNWQKKLLLLPSNNTEKFGENQQSLNIDELVKSCHTRPAYNGINSSGYPEFM